MSAGIACSKGHLAGPKVRHAGRDKHSLGEKPISTHPCALFISCDGTPSPSGPWPHARWPRRCFAFLGLVRFCFISRWQTASCWTPTYVTWPRGLA